MRKMRRSCSESLWVRSSLCVDCLPIGFLGGLWSLTCIITLLRVRGPLVGVWLVIPGLCPLVMSVVSGVAVSSSPSWCIVAFVLPKNRYVVGVWPRMRQVRESTRDWW